MLNAGLCKCSAGVLICAVLTGQAVRHIGFEILYLPRNKSAQSVSLNVPHVMHAAGP